MSGLHSHILRGRQRRSLKTNVEFYTAVLLPGIGIPQPLFTTTFAAARAGGWMADAPNKNATTGASGPSRSTWERLGDRGCRSTNGLAKTAAINNPNSSNSTYLRVAK